MKLSLGGIPISSIYLTNVERIPLSMCCIGGTAININFIQCSYSCSYCPWDAHLDIRSAQFISLDLEVLTSSLNRYKPDVVFFNGGDFWRYIDDVRSILSKILNIDAYKGIKVIAYSAPKNTIDAMLELADDCDIVLIEIGVRSNISFVLDIVSYVVKGKHVELVVVGDSLDDVRDIVEVLIRKLVAFSYILPLNLILNQFDEPQIHTFIDKIRVEYPLAHTMQSKSSEYSSILCPKCRLPVIVRQGTNNINTYLDEDCRCKFCKNKIINIGRSICRARRKVKTPINIPIL